MNRFCRMTDTPKVMSRGASAPLLITGLSA